MKKKRAAAVAKASLKSRNSGDPAKKADALFTKAVAEHQAGRLDAARRLYERAIALQPEFPAAFNNLGLAWLNLGDNDRAIAAFRQAIAQRPAFAEALNNLGSVYFRIHAFAEAAAVYGQAVAARPDYVEGHFNLGNALAATGQAAEAISHYRRALALRPDFPEAYNGVAVVLHRQGMWEETLTLCREVIKLQPGNYGIHLTQAAILRDRKLYAEAEKSCRQAISINPGSPQAFNDLGITLLEREVLDEAADAFRQAIARQSDHAPFHNNLAAALRQRGKTAEALEESLRAVALQPGFPEAQNNLGNVLREANRFEEAVAAYQRAVALKPDYGVAFSNLGNVLRDLGRVKESQEAYRQALTLRPDDAQAQVNYAMALLQDGRFREGWSIYEARWRTGKNGPRPDLGDKPEWAGEDLTGKTILLYGEQGHGDVLQFCRFAPLLAAHLAERGGRVVVAAYPPLLRLLGSLAGVAEVVDSRAPLPAFDTHLPLMSMLRVLGLDVAHIPGETPYLAADPADVEQWRQRLEGLPGLKVGLVWSGDPRPHDPGASLVDRRRSMRLEQFAPLAGLPITLVSLQKGQPATQAKTPPPGLELFDAMDLVKDFADTAALMANLDLIIAVDTSVVHLAGALGRPVWILSRFDGCWRWLQDRDDTPWYPSARLFRQEQPGDWETVVRRVRDALERRIEGAA